MKKYLTLIALIISTNATACEECYILIQDIYDDIKNDVRYTEDYKQGVLDAFDISSYVICTFHPDFEDQ